MVILRGKSAAVVALKAISVCVCACVCVCVRTEEYRIFPDAPSLGVMLF